MILVKVIKFYDTSVIDDIPVHFVSPLLLAYTAKSINGLSLISPFEAQILKAA